MPAPSQPDRPWQHWNRWCLGGAAGVVLTLYGFVALVDPHDHLLLSPPAERVPINQNQRFSYPALARSPRFDSAILGTSTARLLRPADFDALLDGRFVNLSMNSATAYEQSRLLELFLRNHPRPANLLIGLDISWCRPGESLERYTFREFPEWLYDTSPWNDYLHLLNGKALEQAARQVEYWLGRRTPRYGRDGYRNFLPPMDEYDLARAREHLYGAGGARPRARPATPLEVAPETRATWKYPALDLIARLLADLAPETRAALFFVPYHVFSQATPGTLAAAQWDECRARVVRLAGKRAGTRVLDFMIPSPITTRDEHYWDPLHFTTSVAKRVEASIASAVTDDSYRDDTFRWLLAP